MEDLSLKLPQTTCEDTQAATSLQALEGGAAPCGLLDGLKTDPSGQEVALASPSPVQAVKKAKQTKDIYGPYGSASSSSLALQESMENKLLQLFPTDGSTECTLTWKRKDTPSGRLYCQLAASMRPIDVIASGLWPTAQARDWKGPQGRSYTGEAQDLPGAVANWATPRVSDATGGPRQLNDQGQRVSKSSDQVFGANLSDQALGCWATPRANDGEKRGMVSQDPRHGLPGQTLGTMALWPTSKASEATKDTRSPDGALKEVENRNSASLSSHAVALWTTASSRDHKDSAGMVAQREDGKSLDDQLPRQAFGTMLTGSSAVTEKQDVSPQLNPAFVCWVMGFPQEWLRSMVLGMQSFPKSRRGSSKRQCKEKDGG